MIKTHTFPQPCKIAFIETKGPGLHGDDFVEEGEVLVRVGLRDREAGQSARQLCIGSSPTGALPDRTNGTHIQDSVKVTLPKNREKLTAFFNSLAAIGELDESQRAEVERKFLPPTHLRSRSLESPHLFEGAGI